MSDERSDERSWREDDRRETSASWQEFMEVARARVHGIVCARAQVTACAFLRARVHVEGVCVRTRAKQRQRMNGQEGM